ncbi:hypothetical protein Glove_264g46 [Diversispora epigaea]|uniref:Uncharacterized protein n=1 Tax=Diversispora epigaea TaxID=1348612 RepID=A0A397I735_9GLOM|nr:hypothetical protein Glove_264g46 [Diversispora epigaea]
MDDPLSHQLFQKYTPTELHQEGLNRLIACYPDGLERIKTVYQQEVLGIERRNPQGRRTIGVVRTKPKDYNKKRSRNGAKKRITQSVVENSNEVPPTTESAEPQAKRRKTTGTKHKTTKDEITILSVLKIHKNNLPNEAITSVLPPTTESAEPQAKRRKTTGTKHKTTKDEITILSVLKIHKNNLPNEAITSVREKLSEVWTIKKVRAWWNNHKDKN